MKYRIIFFLSLIVMIIGLGGCAGSSMMDTKVTTKKARIIFYVPKTVELDNLTKALYEAVSYRVSDLKENENLLPEELPSKPGSPKKTQMFGGLAAMAGGNPQFEMMQLDTSNAYYTVSGAASMATDFNSKAEYYKAAIYPYKDGYKVYLYLFYQEGTDSIFGAITKAAVDSITGKEGSLLFMAQVRDKFLKLVPQAVIKSQSPRKLEKVVLNGVGWAKNTKSK